MSDDVKMAMVFIGGLLGIFCVLGYGCSVVQRGDDSADANRARVAIEALKIRSQSGTVTTCVEHSVLDRVQVVQQ